MRGFLAICVMLCHIPLISKTLNLPYFSALPLFDKGHEVVLVFFVLSGFLIIGLLYDEKREKGKINIKDFYIRRILRLYPVYYLVLSFGFILYHFLLPVLKIPFDVNYHLLEGIAWSVGFLPNVFRALYEPGSVLTILWSIGIEEQFYLIIAPLLYLLPIKNYMKGLLFFTIGYLLIFHLETFYFLEKYDFLYFFLTSGGLVAIAHRKGIRLYFQSTILRWIVYIIFFMYLMTDVFSFLAPKIYESVFQVVIFNLLIINLSNDATIDIKNRFINYLGKISYGIYMYHMIVVNLVLYVFMKINIQGYLYDWQTIILVHIICLVGTFFASHLSYKYFESYFLKKKEKYRN